MDRVSIENLSERGERLRAIFLPQKGMNMISYSKDQINVIDQKTMPLFEERLAGLGPLIGPHFHHRLPVEINMDFDTTLFPHIARVKKKGVIEPFSHGIARYVPWTYEASQTQIKARLLSSDLYKGMRIGLLEGMEFAMHFEASMMPDGLFIHYRIESEKPSVIGLHTYYHLPQNKGKVIAAVTDSYRKDREILPLPPEWIHQGALHFDLKQTADFGFFSPDPTAENRLRLVTSDYEVHIDMQASTADNSWQLYRPEEGHFVCIEPLSSKTPRKPTQMSSCLEIKIKII